MKFLRALLFGALFLCLSVRAGAQWVTPPLPDSIPTPDGWVRIQQRHPVECPGAWPPGAQFIGCYDPRLHLITIDSGLSPDWQWLVFFHEDCHVAVRSAEVIYYSHEERLCDAIAARRVFEKLGRRP